MWKRLIHTWKLNSLNGFLNFNWKYLSCSQFGQKVYLHYSVYWNSKNRCEKDRLTIAHIQPLMNNSRVILLKLVSCSFFLQFFVPYFHGPFVIEFWYIKSYLRLRNEFILADCISDCYTNFVCQLKRVYN